LATIKAEEMAAINKLTARKVASLTKPGRYGDGGGLWLQISKWGTKSWIFRYMLDGRARQMGLGPVSASSGDGFVTLAEARELAAEVRRQVIRARNSLETTESEILDPIDARRARRMQARRDSVGAMTFKEAAEKYVAAHSAAWRNEKHRAQWSSTLETYAYPVLGKLSIADVDTGLVLKVLEPIWTEKPETAGRVRGRIESILDWGTARHYRDGENPARWRGHLDKLLPRRSKVRAVKHHAAMAYADLPAFMAKLRDMESISARALEFTILSAARTGETIGARWDEIDLAGKTWIVPGDRMKSGRGHKVPLSDRALEILTKLPREMNNTHLFIGARKGAGLSNMAMLELLRGVDGCDGLTVHGFRSSFRDWAGELTYFPREIAEAALAHVLKDKTEAAYMRGDLLAKRRKLMEAWANFCAKPPGKIVPIEHGRKRRA
jgi:integrase